MPPQAKPLFGAMSVQIEDLRTTAAHPPTRASRIGPSGAKIAITGNQVKIGFVGHRVDDVGYGLYGPTAAETWLESG